MKLLGVISDTHGLLRPEALAKLKGVHHIVHAGDIGSNEILRALQAVAPVTAVRGNNDREAWAKTIPETATFQFERRTIHVVHDIRELAMDPAASGVAAVISGHSHKPSIVEKDGVLYLNPGSAGPRRFKLPICVATLRVSARGLKARIHDIRSG